MTDYEIKEQAEQAADWYENNLQWPYDVERLDCNSYNRKYDTDFSYWDFEKFQEYVKELTYEPMSKQQLHQLAKQDVKALSRDNEWIDHIRHDDYRMFKFHENTELTEKEFKTYRDECVKLLDSIRTASVKASVEDDIKKEIRENLKEALKALKGIEDKKVQSECRKSIEDACKMLGIKLNAHTASGRPMKANMNRVIWEGWTPKDFVDALEPEVNLIMDGHAIQRPFQNKSELARWCKDHQPYYKKQVPEVVSYFAKKYGLR